jgi:hypothetical protein
MHRRSANAFARTFRREARDLVRAIGDLDESKRIGTVGVIA